jgi:3-oxoacyl-[acyl-carrier-protein] synthase-1
MIIGVGAQTSIGLTLPATSAAFRSGINAFGRSEYLRQRKNGRGITLAFNTTLPHEDFAYDRMKTLALAAAGEALDPLRDRMADQLAGESRLPLFLSAPPPRPGLPDGSGARMVQELTDSLPVGVDRERCVLMDTGHDGGLALLGLAANMVAEGRSSACLVGGVESYKDIETLHFLEELNRLKTDEQPNGFIPGEAAAFLLVGTRRFARDIGAQPLAQVVAFSRAIEQSPWYMGEPTTGQGLTDALRGALDPQGDGRHSAAVTYADLNGESWRVDEWGYAYLRNAKQIEDPLELRHPADCWGDIGAATGTALAALCAFELAHPRVGAPTALVWSACDTRPFRSAVLIRRHPEMN